MNKRRALLASLLSALPLAGIHTLKTDQQKTPDDATVLQSGALVISVPDDFVILRLTVGKETIVIKAKEALEILRG